MTTGADEPTADELLAELRRSHDRLVAALEGLSDEQVAGPSYDDEWSIAQVASHLGSGAEIFVLFVDAGLRQAPAPGAEEFQPIWSLWNAKTPQEQSRDAVASDAKFLSVLQGLTPDERAAWQLDMFGTRMNLAGLLRLRLGEHALHTWDIAVALDPAATVPDAAAALIVDNLPGLVGRAGKAMPNPRSVHVTTPHRNFVLEPADDGVRLAPASSEPGEGSAQLRLPSEAFVRLVYGRLDAEHTPASVEVEGVDLADLRATFPGF
jgi:uncharacterized protein (TIGR03083 family)